MSEQDTTDKMVKGYYQKKGLSAEKLQQLMDTAQLAKENPAEETANLKTRWLMQRNISIAASLLLAAVILFQWINIAPSQQQVIANISEEIAINHQKQFASDFSEASYAGLSKVMLKLDFKLIDSERLESGEFEILGGRYCSLKGKIAAQIRLRNKEGKIFTLYQASSHEAFEGIPDHSSQARGIDIEMWNEGGVFLGIAG